MGLPFSRNRRRDPKALTGPQRQPIHRPTAAHAKQGEEVRESGWKCKQTQKMWVACSLLINYTQVPEEKRHDRSNV